MCFLLDEQLLSAAAACHLTALAGQPGKFNCVTLGNRSKVLKELFCHSLSRKALYLFLILNSFLYVGDVQFLQANSTTMAQLQHCPGSTWSVFLLSTVDNNAY
eukprot:TRINITY_DN31867_c0_g1_i1.p1 TRINITY_DN31867_c0_g1~~TRINITY_DN31867_c0_g1_i1.p1  ORF type:complete len:103 (+),score=7.85 TRINITY_DN31867_c0_g1_i1:404-712(+)